MDVLKVDILRVSNLSIGKIATIKFPADTFPAIKMIVEDNGQQFKITGIIVTSQPVDSIINQNMENNIFECKIETVTQLI